MRQVFVYGTLMRGQWRNRYLIENGSCFQVVAVTEPLYRLYRIGWWGSYPGLKEVSPGRSIRGEVWDVTEPGLEVLDEVEGVRSGLYERKPVRLQGHTGPIDAYFYVGSVMLYQDLGEEWTA